MSDSSAYAVPKLEAHLYYYGLRGDRHLGPKLIYRTSADVFEVPEPEQDPRKIQLLTTHKHAKLDQNDLWSTISAFSRGGDSGAVIVGADNDFVALLTGGSDATGSPEITYGTPIEWLWENIIKPKFDGAVLFFNPIPDN